MSDKSRSRAGQRERTFGRRWKPSLPDLRSGLKRRSRERSVVWPLMNFRNEAMEDRYRLAVPNSRKRFGRIVLAVTIFRELTGLNDSLGYIIIRGHVPAVALQAASMRRPINLRLQVAHLGCSRWNVAETIWARFMDLTRINDVMTGIRVWGTAPPTLTTI